MLMNCKKCGADLFDGVLSCGSVYHESDDWTHESRQCLRRQLAAANERAGRLEAQMVELRAAWFRVVTYDGFNGAVEAEISDCDMAIFNRILGGS
jgi:hypothetical protein